MRGKPVEKVKTGAPESVADVLRKHVVLEVEGIDRMYLNVYVPVLQAVEGVLKFIRIHRAHPVASTAMVEPITRRFVESIERFAQDNQVPITFAIARRSAVTRTNKSYAWIVKSTALVNHYYFYCLDRDFGSFFLKFCFYFPYNAKLCLNGHEYAKRQLKNKGIEHQGVGQRRPVLRRSQVAPSHL
jgi:hypothetical protein